MIFCILEKEIKLILIGKFLIYHIWCFLHFEEVLQTLRYHGHQVVVIAHLDRYPGIVNTVTMRYFFKRTVLCTSKDSQVINRVFILHGQRVDNSLQTVHLLSHVKHVEGHVRRIVRIVHDEVYQGVFGAWK